MTPLPQCLAKARQPLCAWTLVDSRFAATWDSGEGARLYGGRWNAVGTRCVYAAIDPATAILEVAVHKGFATLDAVPHTLVRFTVSEPARVLVIDPSDLVNPNWARSGPPSHAQQVFGSAALERHPFLLLPSAASAHSWNLLMNPEAAKGLVRDVVSERFALDTRLNPPRHIHPEPPAP